jgi:RHS repeat-associated protein
LPDIDEFYSTDATTGSPNVEYVIDFTTPGTYTLWARGYADNADADALNVGLANQVVDVTGFAPEAWAWASQAASGGSAQLVVESSGLYTVSLLMAEDGMRVDRLLLTTDTTYLPTGDGPAETARQSGGATGETTTITRTLVYTYDNLYRLTNAAYSTGEFFDYTYDASGNRLTQATLAGTNVYTYDNANRLIEVDGQVYTWDDNGNLLNDGLRTFTYDTANRLTSVTSGTVTTQFEYNGDGDRLAQIVGGVRIDYVLDPIGLAQVLVETTGGQSRHYVPGLAQYDGSGWEYFTSDRLGSVRLLVDPNGEVSLAQNFDPFGNVLEQAGVGQSTFGYTGEQMDPTGLVFLRARYYDPSVGRFLTPDTIVPDPLRSMGWNRYAYVADNPLRFTDPSGHSFKPGYDLSKLLCELFGLCGGTTPLPPVIAATTAATTMPAVDPYSAAMQVVGVTFAVALHVTLDALPPFELPGFGEGVETEMGGNICYPEPNISNPLADQPLENFPIPGTTGPNVHVDAPERPQLPDIWTAKDYPRDFPTKNTKFWSAWFNSEGEARALARQYLGRDPVEVEPNKWRSANGKWQYRGKLGDLEGDAQGPHIHLEELNPDTGEVLQNLHLRWPTGTER